MQIFVVPRGAVGQRSGKETCDLPMVLEATNGFRAQRDGARFAHGRNRQVREALFNSDVFKLQMSTYSSFCMACLRRRSADIIANDVQWSRCPPDYNKTVDK